jgi:hypothetical protein
MEAKHTPWTCEKCGSDQLAYHETDEGVVYLQHEHKYLRRSRTWWAVVCGACGTECNARQASMIEDHLFRIQSIDEPCAAERIRLAAPDLLEACQNALEGYRNVFKGRECLNPLEEPETCPCSMCVLRRAIAKATGKGE